VDENAAAVAIAERVVGLPGAGPDDRRRLAASYADLAYARGVIQADRPAGLAQMEKAFAALEPMARDDPGDRITREMLAGFHERASIITEGSSTREDMEKAADLQALANGIYEGLARDFPANATYRRSLVRGYANLASTERLIDRKPQARANVARSVEVARALAAAAPEDSGMQVLLLRSLGVSCIVESDMENHVQAIAFAREALALGDTLPPAVREALFVRANIAALVANLGKSQAELGMAGDSKLPAARRVALMKEGRANLLRARAFRQELVDRKIDASTAARIVRQIDEMVVEIDAAIARLDGA
jgi:hypothetical protein